MIFHSKGYSPATRGQIIVWGLLASYPFGGMTWQVLHYLAGLRRLGFDVWYVEDSKNPLLDPKTYCKTVNYVDNVKYLSRYLDRIGLGNRWIFRHPSLWNFNPSGNQNYCLGATDFAGLVKLYQEADALINLCGANYLCPEHTEISRLIYLQTDPFADQVKIAQPRPADDSDYWLSDRWLKDQLDLYQYLS
jgi:hypothetical protein